MKEFLVFNALIIVLLFSLPGTAFTQNPVNGNDTLRKGAINLYVDCDYCDMNYVRQVIPYANYVRDIREAEVYLLVTSEAAGSGGRQYKIMFQGQGKYSGMNDTLTYTSNPDETSTIIREKRTKMMKMGLMRYVAKTPLSDEIEITHNKDLEQKEVPDRWNNWVFEISTEPRYQAEESNTELNFRNSLNITKITEDIKLEIEMDNFYNREKFIKFKDTDSAETTTYIRSARSMDNLFVKSLGDHWSAGLRWDLGSSTVLNYNFTTEFLPSVEFDIYPYSESNHRQLRILYGAGIQYSNYNDSTIYFKTEETLGKQTLDIAYKVKKKWGSINLALSASNYFHDFSKNRIDLFTDIEWRIFKGLSLNIYGIVGHINDQLYLRKGDVLEAERLLKLTALATKYELRGGIEISYTFGSIYNNTVNPRFGSSRYRQY